MQIPLRSEQWRTASAWIPVRIAHEFPLMQQTGLNAKSDENARRSVIYRTDFSNLNKLKIHNRHLFARLINSTRERNFRCSELSRGYESCITVPYKVRLPWC